MRAPPRRSNGAVVEVKCYSHSLTNGKVRATKYYTATTIDWIAAYDVTTDRCYYVPAAELGAGRAHLSLRVEPARNNQVTGIRRASDYTAI